MKPENNLSLGDRMKKYEDAYRMYFSIRMPVIIRIDGKAFHTLTKNFEKPNDRSFRECMIDTCSYLLNNIQNSVLAYTQSDEISILMVNYEKLNTESWFANNLQKIVSVSASYATYVFNNSLKTYFLDREYSAFFDSRAFIMPKEDVQNYFVWRYKDAVRNSLQSLGQHYIGHKKIQGLNNNELKNRLQDFNIPDHHENHGTLISKEEMFNLEDWAMTYEQLKNFVNRFVYCKEDESKS